MPGHSKIKSKVVQSTINNKDVMNMFHGILGTGEETDLNITIVYPKYLNIIKQCDKYLRLLEAFRNSAIMKHFPAENEHLSGYITSLRDQEKTIRDVPDFNSLHPSETEDQKIDYNSITKEEYEAFAKVYREIKESNIINTIIVSCNNLMPYKKSLLDKTKLKDRFIMKSSGLSFAPLPGLPALNIKHIYISDMITATDKQFILMFLHKLLSISHDMYEVMTSPDIDVDEFVDVIINSLDDVKKQIPRCDEAFKKIRESVGLLKGNFGDYYKDFVASNNPTIIMENFVLDVSKSTKSSPKVTAQFRRIISHYRKLASQQTHNPQMQSLFTQVDKNFKELEKHNQKEDTSETADDGDDDPTQSNDTAEHKPPSSEDEENPKISQAEKKRLKNRKKREKQRRKKVEKQLEEAMNS